MPVTLATNPTAFIVRVQSIQKIRGVDGPAIGFDIK